jgi:hypothetical protein
MALRAQPERRRSLMALTMRMCVSDGGEAVLRRRRADPEHTDKGGLDQAAERMHERIVRSIGNRQMELQIGQRQTFRRVTGRGHLAARGWSAARYRPDVARSAARPAANGSTARRIS